MEEYKLSLLATTLMVNILPPQILNHISAPTREVQEVAVEVIDTSTSMPNTTVDNMLGEGPQLSGIRAALPLLKRRYDVSQVPEAYFCPKERREHKN